MTNDSVATCVSCGSADINEYCADCGERRLHPHDHSLKPFLTETLSEVVSVDRKLLRTIKALFTRPGLLTCEFMLGRRVPYARPFQIFVIANVVYFLLQPLTGYSGYNTPLQSQMSNQFYSMAAGIKQIVHNDAARRHLALTTYEARFNAKSEIYAKSLVFIMVPFFAFFVGLLHLGKRRRLLEHLIFATHYFAWELMFISSLYLLLYAHVLLPLLTAGLRAAGVSESGAIGHWIWMLVWELPTVPLIAAYLALAFRRVYNDSTWGAVTRAVVAVPLLLITMISFRYILFWVTYITL